MGNFEFSLPTEDDMLKSECSIEFLGNNILYNMCSAYPSHSVGEEVHSKLWLIGRSYAAALERNTQKRLTKDIYRATVAALINGGNEFDEMINKLKPISDEKTLNEALAVHKKLLDIFSNTTGMEKRSLASKYLHFHRRDVFYIFDSRASTALSRHVKGSLKSQSQYDNEYYKFCTKAFAFKIAIKEGYGRELDPRELDNLLTYLYETKLKE